MGRITAIEAQKRRGDRRSIFVDGRFVVGAHEEVVLALGLSIGQRFDEEQLVEIIRAETVRKARERALHLLSYRDRSISEVRKRLIGSDFPEDVVEDIVKELSGTGFLDDQKFSRDWVKARSASKPMGKTRLAWELRAKGVDAPVVDEALEDLDEESEFRLALATAEKKVHKADRDDPALKGRLSSFLRRRGFGWEVITRVIGEICPED
ncbi:MAG: RecX family transcriptional regulator [Armatimonadetes bacterium]|nr:RecX family transcriptional regulator [Armatimonadota bacterium]